MVVWDDNLHKNKFRNNYLHEMIHCNNLQKHCHKHKGAQDPGLRMSTLVQFRKLWSHWRKYVGSNLNIHWWNYCFALVFGFMPNQIFWALRLPKYEKTELNSTPWCSSCCRKLEKNLLRPFCTHFAHPQSRILSPFANDWPRKIICKVFKRYAEKQFVKKKLWGATICKWKIYKLTKGFIKKTNAEFASFT